MKSQDDNTLVESMPQSTPMTPLEERVLRMRYGVTPKPHAALGDPVPHPKAVQASLYTMEQDVLRQAPTVATRPRHLRLVPAIKK